MEQIEDLLKYEEFLFQKAMVKGIPLTVAFELSPYCNFNCNMCFIRESQEKISQMGGILSLEDWKHIAIQLKKLGCLFVLLTGGEPLAVPYFEDLYLFLKSEGFIITINTNGTLLNDKFIQIFRHNKPRRVNVTLYGANKDTYKKLCQNSFGFEQTIRGLKLLYENEIATKINFTITKDNVGDLDGVLSLSAQFGFPAMATSHLYPFGRFGKPYDSILNSRVTPDDASYIEWKIRAFEKGISQNDFLHSMCLFKESTGIYSGPLTVECKAGKCSAWINWKGFMTPCIFMETPSKNLLQSNVSEAWNYIHQATEQLQPLHDCDGCQKKAFCNVCYISAKLENAATGTLDYFCKAADAKLYLIKRYCDESM